MADKTSEINQKNVSSNPNKENNPVFNLQRIYLKDLSLEQPNSPEIFLEGGQPETEVNIGVEHKMINANFHECLLKITITAKIKEKTLYLIEGQQAGIFEIQNFKEEDVEKLIAINGATIVYASLQANIADFITRAGFPPIYLAIIDFNSLYDHHKLQAASNLQGQPEVNNALNNSSKSN